MKFKKGGGEYAVTNSFQDVYVPTFFNISGNFGSKVKENEARAETTLTEENGQTKLAGIRTHNKGFTGQLALRPGD